MRDHALSICWIAMTLAMGGCTSDLPPGPPDSGLVTAIGLVSGIEDQTPVDGGITLWLREDDGSTEILQFPSLFTYPPPTQEVLDLYEIVRQVQVGDRVLARGTRIVDDGIALVDLRILEPR